MACTPTATGAALAYAVPRRMTRCECAGMTFRELAERMRAEGLSFRDACRRTGCGQTCTACVPELEVYLASGAEVPAGLG